MVNLRRGDYVAIISESGRAFRKVIWVSQNMFQWTGGEGRLADLTENIGNRKSKYILDLTKNEGS